jgi:hypothetical protein
MGAASMPTHGVKKWKEEIPMADPANTMTHPVK